MGYHIMDKKEDREMEEALKSLVQEMKNEIPDAIAVGIFSIKDGLILAHQFDIPGTDPNIASAVHANVFRTFERFLGLVPEEIAGSLKAITLSVEGAFFFILVDDEGRLAIITATRSSNLGILRVLARKYLDKAVEIVFGS